MKKLLILGMAAALLAGCSSTDDDVLSPEASSEDVNDAVDMSKLMSNVPIEFRSFDGEGFVTRGSFNGDGDEVSSDVGVFCLAIGRIPDGTAANNFLTWSKQSTALNNSLNIWQDNAPATITIYNGQGNLTWNKDINAPTFYPEYRWYNYAFAVYQPRPDSIDYWADAINLYYRLNGSQDVLFAIDDLHAIGGHHPLAYSSAFFNEVENAMKPYFSLDHMCAKLLFKFQLKSPSVEPLFVDSVVIENYPNLGRLQIKRPAENQITLRNDKMEMVDAGNFQGNYWLREQDNTRLNYRNYQLQSGAAISVGDGIMIPPTTRNLRIWVYMKDQDGRVYRNAAAITVSCPDAKEGWKAGNRYSIKINLNSPIPIAAAGAKVNSWHSYGDEENECDIEVTEQGVY